MNSAREFIGRLEAANTEELANMVKHPSDAEEQVLRTFLGSDCYHRLHSLALRREMIQDAIGGPNPENVVVIPGLLGSALSSVSTDGERERIWLSPRQVVAGNLGRLRLDAGGLKEADPAYTIQTSGIMKRYYGELMLSLAENWTVHAFSYDWRKNLKIAAAQLQAYIDGNFSPQETVHIVAHAEGGLVARLYIAQFRRQWARHQGRLIMLGTPNHGMYATVQAFAGKLDIVRWVTMLDNRHGRNDFAAIVRSFPSLYQLLPSPLVAPDAKKLYEATLYSAHQDISQAHLDDGLDTHTSLADVVDPERMICVVGYDQPTFTGLTKEASVQSATTLQEYGAEKLYRIGLDGDGATPVQLARLHSDGKPPVPTLYVKGKRSQLHLNAAVLHSLNDLLTTSLDGDDWMDIGGTIGLRSTMPVIEKSASARTAQAWHDLQTDLDGTRTELEMLSRRVRIRGSEPIERDYFTDEECAIEGILLRGLTLGQVVSQYRHTRPSVPFKPPSIRINLVHGDIAQVTELNQSSRPIDCIAVGQYSGGTPFTGLRSLDEAVSRTLAGHELARDTRGAILESELVLTQYTQRGIVHADLAEPFFFPDPRADGLDINRVIAIAGMGVPGRFGMPELTVLARELCWALSRMGKKHLATVLIGAGRDNLAVSDAVNGWVRGIKAAITGLDADCNFLLEEITFVVANPKKLLAIRDTIAPLERSLRNRERMYIDVTEPDEETLESWRQQANETSFLHRGASRIDDSDSQTPVRITVGLNNGVYRFGAITNRASIPEREIALDANLVMDANDELAAAGDTQRQLRLGQFMERLLLPVDLRDELAGSAPLVMMLDATTARIHWEMLARFEPLSSSYAGVGQLDRVDLFLGTGRGFTRQLRTTFAPPPEPPPPARRLLRILIVADPAADARLAGAEEEGIAVADLFERFNLITDSDNRVEVVRLFGPREATRTTVLRHLMMRTYDVLHFAGHCVYDAQNPSQSGWIFSNGERLTANEFRRIDRVPKFIFSNACESGITPDRSGERAVALAPTLAESFFERGVSNFVCTAWPVDDQAARDFALTLYGQLLGLRFNAERGNRLLIDADNYDEARSQPLYIAMRDARRAIANPPNDIRTWGAYQHYGNPYYRFFVEQQGRDGEWSQSAQNYSAQAEAAPSPVKVNGVNGSEARLGSNLSEVVARPDAAEKQPSA